ncbi:MAG: hypothetical protein ACO1RX_07160 [Candidatus Sericytochromatia bacterium]
MSASDTPKHSHQATLAVGFAGIYTLTYFLTELIPVPLLWYFPLERRWEYTLTPSTGLVMGWYGKVLFCLGLALLSTALLALGLKFSRRPSPQGLQGLLELGTMASVLLTLYYLAYTLSQRVL